MLVVCASSLTPDASFNFHSFPDIRRFLFTELTECEAKIEIIKSQRDSIIEVQKLEISALRAQIATRKSDETSQIGGVSQVVAGAMPEELEAQVRALQQELSGQKDEFWALQVARQEVSELKLRLQEGAMNIGAMTHKLTVSQRENR